MYMAMVYLPHKCSYVLCLVYCGVCGYWFNPLLVGTGGTVKRAVWTVVQSKLWLSTARVFARAVLDLHHLLAATAFEFL
jgi:uncharacterized cysteine cluster protein YcgN (CxxCxxCC family)